MDQGQSPLGGLDILDQVPARIGSRLWAVIPVTHPVLLTVPKEAGVAEEHAGVKEALISTFLQG